MSILSLIPILALLQNPAPAAEAQKMEEAQALIHDLEQGSAKQRRDAKRRLIELGFFARDAVKAGMKHSDPEVAAACTAIWTEIESKASPVEIPGLADFIRAAREKHFNQDAWNALVKNQGPAAILLVADYLSADALPDEEGQENNRRQFGTHYQATDGSFSRAQKVAGLIDPLLGKDESLRAWALAKPEQKIACLKLLRLRQPEFPLQNETAFLSLLSELDLQAVLPHLEAKDSLFKLETAQCIQSKPKFLALLKDSSGRLAKQALALPLTLANTKEAKAAALAAIPDDGFLGEEQLFPQILVVLGDAGLAKESRRLNGGDAGAVPWQKLAAEIADGKIDDLGAAAKGLRNGNDQFSSRGSDFSNVIIALVANGDEQIKRQVTYLLPSYNDDLRFAGMQSELIARARMFGRNGQNKWQAFADQMKAAPAEAIDSYKHYLNAALQRDPKASLHLEAALKGAPHCLPLLLEKILVSPPESRPAAIDAALATLNNPDLAEWFFDRLENNKISIGAEPLAKWMKGFDFTGLTEKNRLISRLVRLCIEKQIDPGILLPLLQEASLNRAMLLLASGKTAEAKAVVKQLGGDDQAIASFLSHLLGEARPPQGAPLANAAFAGLDGLPCPNSGDKHSCGVWELGKGVCALRKGDAATAKEALATSQKVSECACINQWRSLYNIFLAKPDLILPGK